jgi:CheY-like chemotaxis protein
MRIVLADDSDSVIDALAYALKLHGHEVVHAYDGLEALAAIQRHAPQVAIVDLHMPHLDGFGVARAVKSLWGAEAPYLIACSGFDGPMLKKQVYDAGFHQHLTKPFTVQQLLSVIELAPALAQVA